MAGRRPGWRKMTQPRTDHRGPLLTNPLFELSTQDAVSWLRDQPAESVDLLITDPAVRVAGKAPRRRHHHPAEAQQVVEQRLVQHLPQRPLRRAVRGGLPRAQAATRTSTCSATPKRCSWPSRRRSGPGFKFWKPLVWDKRTIGMGYHYRARYEFILFFEKGKRRLNDLGIADVHLRAARSAAATRRRSRSAVSEVLIGQSSEPGEVVADPFMGSGSVGVAAAKLGRRFLGNDLNPEAVQLRGAAAARVRRRGCRERGRPPARRRPGRCSSSIGPRADDRRRVRQPGRPYVSQPLRRARRRRSTARSASARRSSARTAASTSSAWCEDSKKAFAIECKFQDSQGPWTRRSPTRSTTCTRCRWPAASPMPARDSRPACCTCSPPPRTPPTACPRPRPTPPPETKELDHLLAMHFGWWDVLVGKKKPIAVSAAASPSIADDRVDSPADFSNTLWPPPGA